MNEWMNEEFQKDGKKEKGRQVRKKEMNEWKNELINE